MRIAVVAADAILPAPVAGLAADSAAPVGVRGLETDEIGRHPMSLTLTDLQTVAGLTVVVLILTQLVKGYLPEPNVPHFAVLAGIVVSVLATLVLGPRDAVAIGNAILTGLLGGSASVGLYQVQKPMALLSPKVTANVPPRG